MKRFKPYLEWKYLLNDKQVFLFKQKFASLLQEDENSVNGRYTVSTIYFDTENFDFYQDKLEGEYYKIKIRIRSYLNSSNAFDSHKFELKIKNGDETIKLSKPIDETTVKKLCSGNISGYEILSLLPENKNIPKDFILKRVFSPVSELVYNRSAWFFPLIPDLRITIDNSIKAINPKNKTFFSVINEIDNILEIKSNSKIPMIFQNYLNELNIEREAFSKYSNSVERLYRL